ncbi:MAG: SpoIIE family protein phosphatase [Bacteroidota bacterium]
MIAVVLGSLVAFVFALLGKFVNFAFLVGLIIDSFFILYLNYKKKYRWTRLLLALFAPVITTMSVSTKLTGDTTSLNFFFTPWISCVFLGLLPVLVADFRDRWISFFSILPALLCVFFFDIIHQAFGIDFYDFGLSGERFFFTFAYSFFFIGLLGIFYSQNQVANIFQKRIEGLLRNVRESREELQQQHEQMTASINYASRIQQAMLPDAGLIHRLFPENFIFYRPRDIVSGDFYWFGEENGQYLAAAVDCTGHGVPGAFMSMIGNDLLTELIREKKLTDPGEILTQLHLRVRSALRQGQTKNRDGMDIALISYNPKAKILRFAGAKNPLLISENGGAIRRIKGDRAAIGGTIKDFQFTTHTFELSAPTQIFLYSDGFQDQFGGKDKRKFFSKRFRELLGSLCSETPEVQCQKLETTFDNWLKEGNTEQTDDVLVIGIQL